MIRPARRPARTHDRTHDRGHARRLAPLTLVALLLATACTTTSDNPSGAPEATPSSTPSPSPSSSSPSPTPTPTATPTPTQTLAPAADAVVEDVPAEQWEEMRDAGMVREGCPVTSPDQLRRVEVNYHGFDGQIHRGVLVVNADTAESVARIFTEIFDAQFPIRSMRPMEEYDGDNTASLAADNTAAFNCRTPDQINAPPAESPHANGRAIDINPLENPWKDLRCDCWQPSAEFQARTEGEGKILEGGPVWQAFDDEGWVWQDIDVPDYMHFDTGYPSTPYSAPGTPAP
ncbi:M15 family metallopeptidase [Streptomyces sp. NPDC056716]|uniref:M15 family metallopeptidase n=1 Tax=unclassified Streptomyces TaxID=2593676 RepID=UPI0036745E3D